jgi:hypothetical protein
VKNHKKINNNMDDNKKQINLYKVILDYNNVEKYIIGEDIVTALKKAQRKFSHDIVSIKFIQENVNE